MSWIPILTAPEYGEKPYDWGNKNRGQCTWYAYYRVQKNGWTPPCYYDRSKKTVGWGNAKDWLANFREPWEAIYVSQNPDYDPVPGDIIVFNGTYGHVAVIEEKISTGEYWVSDYNRAAKESYGLTKWHKGDKMPGYNLPTGPVLGYLHYTPNTNEVIPVDRNTNANQIYAPNAGLRVRLAPSLNGTYYCSITPGYYNVYGTIPATDEDKDKSAGLECWYEIGQTENQALYCANVTTEYLPAQKNEENQNSEPTPTPQQPEDSVTVDLEKTFNELKTEIANLIAENEKLNKQKITLEAENATLQSDKASLQKQVALLREYMYQIADIARTATGE